MEGAKRNMQKCGYSKAAAECECRQVTQTIDLYHALTILVMLPVSITVMNANIHCANVAPGYYFVQPQFGYNELEWSKIKMATP